LGFCSKVPSAEQTSSLQVLESSNYQDDADGNVECRSINSSGESVSDDSNGICLNASQASHGVEQVGIHSQVAAQGTALVNVYNAKMAIHQLSTTYMSTKLIKPLCLDAGWCRIRKGLTHKHDIDICSLGHVHAHKIPRGRAVTLCWHTQQDSTCFKPLLDDRPNILLTLIFQTIRHLEATFVKVQSLNSSRFHGSQRVIPHQPAQQKESLMARGAKGSPRSA
jgi:hypothetical protein